MPPSTPTPPPSSAFPAGLVLTRARQGVLVQDEHGSRHWCRVPGKGSLLAMPAPGDRVRFIPSTDTKDGRIEAIEPRASHLERYSYGRKKDIAANMDRLLLLATPRDPVVSPRLVDRMLVGASVGGLEAVIVANKADLFADTELDDFLAPWAGVYPTLRSSAVNGDGLDTLTQTLTGERSLLIGASGVGKSTLLNALIEGLELDTSAVSDATGRGVHTTTATFLYPVPGGGMVADTPGVREFHPVLDDIDQLERHFPEFAPHREECRFDDCLHLPGSKGCAVFAAVRDGAIHPARHESYLLLRESLKEGPKRGRQQHFDPRPNV